MMVVSVFMCCVVGVREGAPGVGPSVGWLVAGDVVGDADDVDEEGCEDVESAGFPSADDLVEGGPGGWDEWGVFGGEVGDLGEAGVVVDEGGGAGADLVEEFSDAGFGV